MRHTQFALRSVLKLILPLQATGCTSAKHLCGQLRHTTILKLSDKYTISFIQHVYIDQILSWLQGYQAASFTDRPKCPLVIRAMCHYFGRESNYVR